MIDTLIPPAHLPPPLRTDGSNPFAHNTLRVRVPVILRETSRLNPDFDDAIHDALNGLADAMAADAPIPAPTFTDAPDYAEWSRAHAEHADESWLNAEWWFAEVYAYRLVVEITRWRQTGRDPFLPKKREELEGGTLWAVLGKALSTETEGTFERLHDLFAHALWGNRIDLSMDNVRARGTHWNNDDLLADDRDHLIEQLLSRSGDVHFINDNAGSELALDLVLADALLDGVARTVTLHLKHHPTFVSDATRTDVQDFIARLLDDRQSAFKAIGDRLAEAQMEGRLILKPDPWWNSARFLWQFPESYIRSQFANASLVIVKGDANYRRVIGDALWPTTTPFAHVTRYFPAPLVCLRTLKSDPVVGLAAGLEEGLNTRDHEWRVNGRHGVIQFKP